MLRLDDMIDKKNKEQLQYVFSKLLAAPRPPVQIAFLQGAIPMQSGELFDQLLDFLEGRGLEGQRVRGSHGASGRAKTGGR